MANSSGNIGRTQGRRGEYQRGKVPPSRTAWAEFFSGKISVSAYPEHLEGGDPDNPVVDSSVGASVSLSMFSGFERRSIKFILTNLTGAELDAFERVMLHAIKEARPAVELRDTRAREALEDGDDSYERSYRGLPTVVVRDRQG